MAMQIAILSPSRSRCARVAGALRAERFGGGGGGGEEEVGKSLLGLGQGRDRHGGFYQTSDAEKAKHRHPSLCQKPQFPQEHTSLAQ